MARDGRELCSFMAMFSQSDYSIVLKFHQYQYVTTLFNPNDQDSIMSFTKSSGLGTIYYAWPGLTNFDCAFP